MVRIDRTDRLTPVQSSGGGKGSVKPSAAGERSGIIGGGPVEVPNAAVPNKRIYMIMADMPEVWMERVEEIRDALASGRFSFDSREVATRIVRNALAEHPWK